MDVGNLINNLVNELARITGVAHPVAVGWLWFMAIALAIALLASLPVRRPLSSWLGDLFIRWGLAGILVWFVVNGLWALRELLNIRLIIPFTPLEGYLEYATAWAAVLTGVTTFIFFGSALLLRAIFDKEELPRGVIYYKQEILIASAVAQPTPQEKSTAKEEGERTPAIVVDRRNQPG